MIEYYLKYMSIYQYTFSLLSNLVLDEEMMYLCLVRFIKNDDLIEACEK